MGHEEFMSQDEVDALLKGVTGEADADAERKRPCGRTALQPRDAGTHRPRPHARRSRSSTSASRACCASACSTSCAARAEISVGPVQVSEVQRIHPQPAGADQPEPGAREAAARHRAVRVRSEPGVPRGRQPVRRRRPLPHPRRRPRLHADRAAHHPAHARPRVRAPTTKSWKSRCIRCKFEYVRSEMNTQFANIATPNEVVVVTHVLRSSSARPAARSTSACRTR